MDLTPARPPYYTSALLPVPHGMFTCAGGVSNGHFASLNLSYHVGDRDELVGRNRELARSALGLARLLSVHQVHGDRVLAATDQGASEEVAGYDAIISNQPGVGLLIQQADCQAVLLADEKMGVVAAVHCGWRGSVLGIIAKTIARMHEVFGVEPEELRAVISPSLGPCCAEFVNFRRELPEWMHTYQAQPAYFDFWAISRRQLTDAGLHASRIDTAGLCTRCGTDFFSHRRASRTANGVTGRNGSIIGLPMEADA